MSTPKVKTIAELVAFLNVDIRQTIKAVVVEADDGQPVLLPWAVDLPIWQRSCGPRERSGTQRRDRQASQERWRKL